MVYSHNAPFRADVVGSYLRPAELKAAREDFAAGKIDAAALKAVEDKAITELVAKQKAAGLHVITDGEFRRGWWHFDFMWGFNGVDHAAAAHRVAFHDEVTPADTATVTGRISGENHPFVEHFKFVKQFEDENTVARQTMPSPAQTRFVLTGNAAAYPYDEFYKNDDELTADIVAAYRQVIADLYAAGCRNVPVRRLHLDPPVRCERTRTSRLERRGRATPAAGEPRRHQRRDRRPAGRPGHQHPRVPRQLPLHLAFLRRLRAGRGQTVRRGERGRLLPRVRRRPVPAISRRSPKSPATRRSCSASTTSKKPDLDGIRSTIKARIQEAAQYIPLDRLCLSTQCGFAFHPGRQQAHRRPASGPRLALVQSIAKDVWGE